MSDISLLVEVQSLPESKVYRVECRKSGGSFAAKQLVTTRKKQRDNALAEINLIKDLASPYIIRLSSNIL